MAAYQLRSVETPLVRWLFVQAPKALRELPGTRFPFLKWARSIELAIPYAQKREAHG